MLPPVLPEVSRTGVQRCLQRPLSARFAILHPSFAPASWSAVAERAKPREGCKPFYAGTSADTAFETCAGRCWLRQRGRRVWERRGFWKAVSPMRVLRPRISATALQDAIATSIFSPQFCFFQPEGEGEVVAAIEIKGSIKITGENYTNHSASIWRRHHSRCSFVKKCSAWAMWWRASSAFVVLPALRAM